MEKSTFEEQLEGTEGGIEAFIARKRVSGRKSSQRKGPGAGICMAWKVSGLEQSEQGTLGGQGQRGIRAIARMLAGVLSTLQPRG